jgi:hypothetical protein
LIAGVLSVSLAVGLFADGSASAQMASNYRPNRPNYGPGPSYGPGNRPGHHHHHDRDRGNNTGALVAVGAIGLIAGIALAKSNRERYDPPPAPVPYGDVDPYTQGYQGGDFQAYCARKFNTYDPRDGRYLAQDGRRYPCH